MYIYVMTIKVPMTMTYGMVTYGVVTGMEHSAAASRESSKVLFLNLIGDYKGVCLTAIHQTTHLLFIDILFLQ